MITAICNIYINSNEKINLFKQTFPLVYEISDNWLINIRGKYNAEAIEFIKGNLKNTENNCIFFSGLNEKNWVSATDKMLKRSKYDHVYIYLEDHFLLKTVDHFRNVVQDMIKNGIEYFQYSFFNIGLTNTSTEVLYPEYSKFFYTFSVTNKIIPFLKKNNSHFYPYSLTSISTKEYFEDLLRIEKKFLIEVPSFLQVIMQNSFFFYPRDRAIWFWINNFFSKINIRFIIYPKSTPFNLEKSLFDCDKNLLPIKIGGLREELFANWDDDNKLNNSSLIKRGLYPEQLFIEPGSMIELENSVERRLLEGESTFHQYCPDVPRIKRIPRKKIFIKLGVLRVFTEKEFHELKKGESIIVAANIPHTLLAQEDCVYQVSIESGLV